MILVAFTQTYLTWKNKTRFMLSMVIGEYSAYPVTANDYFAKYYLFVAFALGLAMRFGLHTNPEGKGCVPSQPLL